jgi:hypothetical protein
MTTATKTLYRAADDDSWSDCAAFAETLATARAYLDNPGFGGARLWSTDVEIDMSRVLDVVGAADATGTISDAIGQSHPGAIGADEYAPRVSYEIREAGYDWVRVAESFPANTVTWIFVGSDDPELTEVTP